MSDLTYLIGLLVGAVVVTTILTVGTLGAARMLPGQGDRSAGGERS
ncbi:hypothetical protein [Nocardioides halotolerans]|jgi:hypothetical protein|nr:hypothetical protein [Nocardioides halotolerans]